MTIPWYKKYAAVAGCVAICYPMALHALHPMWKDKTKRPEKTVIITGATGNIGRATAYAYAVRHCRVIMACRDMDKCKAFRRHLVVETKNKSLCCRHLDLEDIDSINKFVDDVSKDEPHIDILVNNAAVKTTKGKELTKYGLEKHFFVNFMAPYLLTLRLLPKLEESAATQKDSRIINVVGRPKRSWRQLDLDDVNFESRKFTPQKAYFQSKLAFAYFTIMLDKMLRERNSRILVFANGFKAERIYKSFNLEHHEILRTFLRFTSHFQHDPEDLSTNSCYCGLEPELGVEDSGSLFKYLRLYYGSNKGWGWVGNNEELARLVWNYAANFLLNLPEPKASEQGGGQSEGDNLVGDSNTSNGPIKELS